jgi:hypothetical protein
MLTSEEQALMDYLERYFDRLMPTGAPLEPSLHILVRMLAGVLATEMGARGQTEAALTGTVDPYQRLLKTWTREAFQFATRRYQGWRN